MVVIPDLAFAEVRPDNAAKSDAIRSSETSAVVDRDRDGDISSVESRFAATTAPVGVGYGQLDTGGQLSVAWSPMTRVARQSRIALANKLTKRADELVASIGKTSVIVPFASLRQELENSHGVLGDSRQEGFYRDIISIVENALSLVKPSTLDRQKAKVLRDVLAFGSEDRALQFSDSRTAARRLKGHELDYKPALDTDDSDVGGEGSS